MKRIKKLVLFALIPVMAISVLSAKFMLPSKKVDAAAFNAQSVYEVAGGLVRDPDPDKPHIKYGGWQAEYDLGDKFTPGSVSQAGVFTAGIPSGTRLLVKYPDGSIMVDNEAAARQLTFDVAGYYTAVYTVQDGVDTEGNPVYKPATKEFRFKVTAKTYQIEVDYNASGIPTLLKKGGKFILPKASVIWTDERDEVQYLDDPDIEVTVNTVETKGAATPFSYKKATDDKEIVAPADGGKIFITYAFGMGMKDVIQKDYVVTITDSINESITPTLNVNTVSSDVPLMSKVVLPTASATDDQDKNVKIEVSVKTPGSGTSVYTVKENMLDEYMVEKNESSLYIADKYKDPADTDNYYARDTVDNPNRVTLDNKQRNMTFYPDKTGLYEITYKATNDVGKTASTTFKVNVTDTLQPYIKIKSTDIPGDWTNNKLTMLVGDTKVEKTYNAATDADLLRLHFPKPSFADNASLETAMKEKADNVKVELYKDNGNDPLEVMTYSASENKYISNLTVAGDQIIKENTDVSDKNYGKFYIPASKLAAGADYNIVYTVSDTASPVQTAKASFAVKIKTEFKDVLRPGITFKDMVNTLKVGDKFTKPNITVSDASGTWTKKVSYSLFNSVSSDEAVFSDANMKELFYKGSIDKFNLEVLQSIKPGATFGTEANQFDQIKIKVYAVDAVGNVKEDSKTVEIINTEKPLAAPTFEAIGFTDNGIKYVGKDIEYTEANGQIALEYTGDGAGADGEFSFKSEVVIKDISVKQTGKDVYVGYEFALRNEDGDVIGAYTTTKSWIDNRGADTVLKIDEFKVLASELGVGKYTITLSVFNVSNASSSVNFTLEVLEEDDYYTGSKGVVDAVLDIPESLEYGRSIKLPDLYYTNNKGDLPALTNEDYQYKRIVYGPHYSLQGFELLAYKTGYYTITMETENVDPTRYEKTVKVDDTVGPDVNLTGVMPTVSIDVEKDVFLPGMVASDIAGIDISENYKESVKVANGGSSRSANLITADVKAELILKDPTLDGKIEVGMYYFTPFAYDNKVDGKYTVTYSATDNNSISSSSLSFTIEIGDVFVPVIKLVDGKSYADEMKKGAKFTFKDFTATDETYEKKEGGGYEFKSGVELKGDVTITLTAPDGSVILTYEKWTSTKKYENYTATMEKAGVYTVTYKVSDKVGNEGTLTYKITVVEKTKTSPINEKVLAVILIVAGVLLIAGVAFYFVRFRRKAQ